MTLRHADEWVGLLVVAAVLLFLGVILQAGVLRDWFRPTSTLRIVLPKEGVGGLAVGADVEVLGTKAGTVRRIVIDPQQEMYGEARIDKQAQAFIRRDSQAVIRRRFGIAGAAYVDITRGTGPELDWNYAVIEGVTERAPTESVGALIDQVRERVFPILDDFGRSARALATMMERTARGEGNVGRLLADDQLARDAEATVTRARELVARIDGIAAELKTITGDVASLARTANAPDSGVPAVLRRTDQMLASLEGATRNLSRATRRAPEIASNVEEGTTNLPSLLMQLQQTGRELEQLLTQLRSLWLLGGGGEPSSTPPRLSPTEIRP